MTRTHSECANEEREGGELHPPSRPRMKRLVDFFKPGVIHVRVDLRRGNARVTEHLLHLPQVGAAGQHVRGKTVP